MIRWDRQLWLCILIATAVLVPRSCSVMRHHNETLDSDFHLRHGLTVLLGVLEQFAMDSNDPPLGQMILSLPLVVTGNVPGKPIHRAHWPAGVSVPGEASPGEAPLSPQRAQFARTVRRGVLYGNAWSPEALMQLIAVWKAVLFVPFMAVVFQWSRAIYGLRGAWLSQGLILADPTIAANVPVAALDSLGLTAIVIACFCAWRYFERPSFAKLALASVMIAAAMLIKHTAVILPGVFLTFAIRYWVWRDWRAGVGWEQWRAQLRPRVNALLAAGLIGAISLWALLLFDFSIPADQFRNATLPTPTTTLGHVLDDALLRRWPAGTYIGCFLQGLWTSQEGQGMLLLGSFSRHGWWYYFPALMTLKVPLGIWLVLALGLASLLRRWIVRDEFTILVPLLAWLVLLLPSGLNYSFRHFMPAYVFMLMWCGRALMRGGAALTALAWTGVAAAALHGLWFHPDYLSYVNFPREQIWMQMTDGNLDWDTATRQIGPWLDEHPQPGRTVHVAPRGGRIGYAGPYFLGDRVRFVERGKPPPTDGILIISPVWVCGVYDEPGKNPYAFLLEHRPIDMVGHSMLVYDLDAINRSTQ